MNRTTQHQAAALVRNAASPFTTDTTDYSPILNPIGSSTCQPRSAPAITSKPVWRISSLLTVGPIVPEPTRD